MVACILSILIVGFVVMEHVEQRRFLARRERLLYIFKLENGIHNKELAAGLRKYWREVKVSSNNRLYYPAYRSRGACFISRVDAKFWLRLTLFA